MKIAIAFHPINSMGGIINHTEHLAAGLMELGHQVELLEMVWSNTVRRRSWKRERPTDQSVFGCRVCQYGGWELPADNRVKYKGDHRHAARKRLNSYDLVIWTVSAPSTGKINDGNEDWMDLYRLDVPQIAVVHDGNVQHLGAHLLKVSELAKKLFVAAVHPCAYHGCGVVPVPRALIFNPQPPMLESITPWADRKAGFLSCQTFKRWKRVDDLIRAIPHLPKKLVKKIAGGGIEHNYLTSKEKCREEYFFPANHPKFPGQRIWDTALKHGMEFSEYITNEKRDEILMKLRCLVDPSWSRSYAKIGDHFNRVVVDAIRVGAIPIAHPLGISTNVEGEGEVFKPWVHYIPLPVEGTDEEYAARIEEACTSLDPAKALQMQLAGQELFANFDRTRVAEQFIELMQGKPTGWYGTLEVGEATDKIREKCDKLMTKRFTRKTPVKSKKQGILGRMFDWLCFWGK
jgi:glycosyltransferase involved in cell wall biosynthesis